MREKRSSKASQPPQTHQVKTYEPKRQTDAQSRQLIRNAVTSAGADTAGRALRPAI